MNIRWKAVIRDSFIVMALTFMGGFIVGMASGEAESSRYTSAIAVSNLMLGTVGFVISGCMARVRRFQHLTLVALCCWILSLSNLLLAPLSLIHWFFGCLPLAFMMLIGGLVSYLFVAEPRERPVPHSYETSPPSPTGTAGTYDTDQHTEHPVHTS